MTGRAIIATLLMLASLCAPAALGQERFGPPLVPPAARSGASIGTLSPGATLPTPKSAFDEINPASVLAGAAEALPGSQGPGGERRGLSTALNIVLVLTVLGLAPSILLMTTCFLRIVIVLALLKQALGTQQMPPSQVLLGLALIMTLLVMSPTMDRVYREAVLPYRNGEITDYTQLWDKAKQPIRDFMFDQIEATGNFSGVYMVLNYRGVDTSDPSKLTRADVDMVALVPAFVLSELKVAFLMGFKVYLPFLVIDMVISAILISMSMMMLPPVLISLPFKLLLFVLVDGWQLIVGSLMQSFVTHPLPPAAAVLWPGGGAQAERLLAQALDLARLVT